MKNSKTKRIVLIAMFSAIATIVMTFKFPVGFAPSFYKFDLSDAIVLIGACILGPIDGIVIEGVKVLLNLIIDGTVTAGIGELSNFLMGCAFVVPASIIYRKNKNAKNLIKGVVIGVITLCVVACTLNAFVLLPAYAKAFNMPIEVIVGLGTKINPKVNGLTAFIFMITLPFNLLKGGVCAVVGALVQGKLGQVIDKIGK